MSKKYKNKTCAYCGTTTSDTEDHIFAREFFAIDDRANLPKVPACKKCNGQKATLEHYITTVFAFGSRHPSALSIMLEKVPRRLQKNHALFRALYSGQKNIFVQESPGGVIQPTMAVPLDGTKIVQLFQYIARGLMFFHWKNRLAVEDVITVKFFKPIGEERFKESVSQCVGNRVQADLGNGTIRYDGIQDVAVPIASIWRIQMLGGINIASDDAKEGVCSTVTIFTAPRNIQAKEL